MPERRRLLGILAASLALPALRPVLAQTITQDPRLLVPYAPGGTVDLVARVIAEGLTPRLGGRSIVVESRSGAGTLVAMQAVANAPPNGMTLSLTSSAFLATGPVMPGLVLPLDLDTALAPVMQLIRVPMVLVGKPDAPFTDLPGLIAFAKANPGKLNIGNSGAGGQTHLLAARLQHEARIEMEHIQYRGGTPALLDIMAGNSDLYFGLLPEALPFIRDRRLRAIAFASPERNPALPEIALMKDTLPGFTGDVAYGLAMGANTPAEWITFWNTEINRVIARPDIRERMLQRLWVPVGGTPQEYRAEILEDRRVWGAVIRAANIRAGS